MTDTSGKPSKLTPRRRKWLLIGSLAINFFFIAALVVSAIKHWHGHGHWRGGPDAGLGGARGGPMLGMKRLLKGDFDDDPELEALRARHADVLREALDDAWATRKFARNVLRNPDRSPAELEAALSEVRRATNYFQQTMHEMILDAAAALPPEDYKRLMRSRHWHRD